MEIPINPTNRYMIDTITNHDPKTGKPIQEIHVFPPARAHWEATDQHSGAGQYVIKQEHFPTTALPKHLVVLESVIRIEVKGPYPDEDEEPNEE